MVEANNKGLQICVPHSSREISKEEPQLRLPLDSDCRGRYPDGFYRKAERYSYVSLRWS